jgi:hypothetical protein
VFLIVNNINISILLNTITYFIENNREFIKPLTETNSLNNNLENGVTEKICYES